MAQRLLANLEKAYGPFNRDVAATLTQRMLRIACARAGQAIVE